MPVVMVVIIVVVIIVVTGGKKLDSVRKAMSLAGAAVRAGAAAGR